MQANHFVVVGFEQLFAERGTAVSDKMRYNQQNKETCVLLETTNHNCSKLLHYYWRHYQWRYLQVDK